MGKIIIIAILIVIVIRIVINHKSTDYQGHSDNDDSYIIQSDIGMTLEEEEDYDDDIHYYDED